MNADYLGQLDEAVRLLLTQRSVLESIQALRQNITTTDEPFVWSVLDLAALRGELPASIRSGWIFVLARNVGSGCHFHPNSIQHMVMIEGQGRSQVDGESRRMIPFDSVGHGLNERWYVIGKGVPHEFFPEERDMVVFSFHTVAATDLEEVSCTTGERRQYEGR